MTNSPPKVAIVEEDLNTLKLLKLLLEVDFPEIELVNVFDSYDEARQLLKTAKIDLLILGIQKCAKKAFDFLTFLGSTDLRVVLSSMHPEKVGRPLMVNGKEYLIQAITKQALEVLIKRTQISMLEKEILQKQKNNRELRTKVITRPIVNAYRQESTYTDVVTIPLIKGRTFVVNVKNMVRCESRGDMSSVFFIDDTSDKIITTKSLMECERDFPKEFFFRVHKQHLINLSHVDKMHQRQGLHIEMINGEKIPLARRRKQDFIERLRRFKSEE